MGKWLRFDKKSDWKRVFTREYLYHLCLANYPNETTLINPICPLLPYKQVNPFDGVYMIRKR